LVAGSAYRLLIGKNIETVVLVGLSHKYNLKGAVVYSRGSFLTPLGNIEIDEQMASEIMEQADIDHMPKAHQVEHCLEVQLPFLQQTIGSCKIVPILVNDDSIANISTLSNAISKSMIGRSTLLIGSTDLCHYPTYSSAIRADQVTISALSAYDTNYLRMEISAYMNQPRIPNLQCLMCSTAATYTTIETSKILGGKRLQILAANNSGDVPQGDLTQVVGYVSAAIY